MFSKLRSFLEGSTVERLSFILIGGFACLIFACYYLGKLADEREIEHTRIISLQSCYYSAVKFANMDSRMSMIFCDKYSRDMTVNYKDIQDQMNKIIDKKYDVVGP